MLYQGNFSYTDMSDAGDNYCLTPCLCTADSPEDALDKFRALLERIHSDTDVLAGATQVYLDSLIELSDVPSEAVLCSWTKVVPHEDGLYSITSALPDPASAGSSYSFVDDDEVMEEYVDSEWVPIDELSAAELAALEELDEEAGDADKGDEVDEQPFLSFVDEA